MPLLEENLANYETAWSVREYTREEGLMPIEAALVEEFFPDPGARVLDLGCGAGRTTAALADKGFEPIGIDLASALLKEARARHPQVDFRRMDASRLDFPEDVFDAAVFSYNGVDCLYPLAARVMCFREVFRVLKPGGTFLLSSHNLIGSIWSGGFYYARGYWNALRTLARQATNPVAFEWFIRYRDRGGTQYLYSAPPSRTVKQLESVGFQILDVRGASGERRPRAVRFHEQHVHFAARKPA